MAYLKSLPRMSKLVWLAKLARPFPATAGDILKTARKWSFSHSTTGFLQLFPKEEEFKNMDDFLTRCEELELFIREERQMPAERLRSSQG